MYGTATLASVKASVAYGNTGSKIGRKIPRRPSTCKFGIFLPRRLLEQKKLEAAAELAGQILLLALKIVQKRLEQRARGWLSLAMLSCLA